jgi:hypothetical protein
LDKEGCFFIGNALEICTIFAVPSPKISTLFIVPIITASQHSMDKQLCMTSADVMDPLYGQMEFPHAIDRKSATYGL